MARPKMPEAKIRRPDNEPGDPPPPDLPPSASRDLLTPEERSRNMARIRSHNTKPEKTVRQLVTALGLRYRLQRRDLPGKPDLVFSPRRTVIFVHGCFWHQHANCRAGRFPTANRDFWTAKLTRNTQRDAETKRALQKSGWRVLTVWECETKHPAKLQRRLARLLPPTPKPQPKLQPI